MRGSLSVSDFAKKRGISYGTLKDRAAKGKWLQKRKQDHEETTKAARRKVIEKSSDSLASQIEQSNAEDLEIAALIREQIKKHLEETLPPNDLRTITLTSKTVQEIVRIATSADKEDTGPTEDATVGFLE